MLMKCRSYCIKEASAIEDDVKSCEELYDNPQNSESFLMTV